MLLSPAATRRHLWSTAYSAECMDPQARSRTYATQGLGLGVEIFGMQVRGATSINKYLDTSISYKVSIFCHPTLTSGTVGETLPKAEFAVTALINLSTQRPETRGKLEHCGAIEAITDMLAESQAAAKIEKCLALLSILSLSARSRDRVRQVRMVTREGTYPTRNARAPRVPRIPAQVLV